jgi:hypothetical protein
MAGYGREYMGLFTERCTCCACYGNRHLPAMGGQQGANSTNPQERLGKFGNAQRNFNGNLKT